MIRSVTPPRCLLVLMLAGLAAACGDAQPGAESGAPAAAPPAVPVAIVELSSAPVEQIGEFVGTVTSLRSTTVQPQAEGFITDVLVTSGTRVTRGMPLFTIDAATQRAAVASLEAQRAARVADLEYARQQAERTRTLLDAGGVSRQANDQAVAELQSAQALLAALDDQIRQARAELDYYRVVAQTSGVVGDVPARVGDRVTRSTVLTTIEDNAQLEVHVGVPVQDAPRLRVGQPLRIIDEAGQVLLDTRLSFVAASVDDGTQTVLAKAPVPARGTQFRAGQFVRTRIVWSVEPGLTLPVLAVQRVNNQYFAFVAEPAGSGLVARQRPVVLGPLIGDAYTVLGGLAPGDRLILAGTQKIGDGAPVQPLPQAAGGAPGSSGTVN
jgi:RND family efflux transporter MFP subunit